MHTLIIRRVIMGSWGLISDVDHKATWGFPTPDAELSAIHFSIESALLVEGVDRIQPVLSISCII